MRGFPKNSVRLTMYGLCIRQVLQSVGQHREPAPPDRGGLHAAVFPRHRGSDRPYGDNFASLLSTPSAYRFVILCLCPGIDASNPSMSVDIRRVCVNMQTVTVW